MKKLIANLVIFFIVSTSVFCQTFTNIPTSSSGNVDKVKLSALSILIDDFIPPKPAPSPDLAGAEATKFVQDGLTSNAREVLATWQKVTEYATNNQEEFNRILEFATKFPDLVQVIPQSASPEISALAYSILVLQASSVTEKYLSESGFTEGNELMTAVRKEMKELKGLISKASSPKISVFATGNIKGAALNNSKEATSTGTGTLGASYSDSKNIISVQFSVASTMDTVNKGYGSSILSPVSGNLLKSAVLEWFPKIKKLPNSYLHFYGNFSSSLWEVEKDKNYKNASIFGFGALFHQKLYGGFLGETGIGVEFEIGPAIRTIGGDLRNLIDSDVTKEKFLLVFPTTRNYFPGVEGGLTLNFGNVVGALQVYYLTGKKGEHIEGLTRAQISVGLSVKGEIFKGLLKDKAE